MAGKSPYVVIMILLAASALLFLLSNYYHQANLPSSLFPFSVAKQLLEDDLIIFQDGLMLDMSNKHRRLNLRVANDKSTLNSTSGAHVLPRSTKNKSAKNRSYVALHTHPDPSCNKGEAFDDNNYKAQNVIAAATRHMQASKPAPKLKPDPPSKPPPLPPPKSDPATNPLDGTNPLPLPLPLSPSDPASPSDVPDTTTYDPFEPPPALSYPPKLAPKPPPKAKFPFPKKSDPLLKSMPAETSEKDWRDNGLQNKFMEIEEEDEYEYEYDDEYDDEDEDFNEQDNEEDEESRWLEDEEENNGNNKNNENNEGDEGEVEEDEVEEDTSGDL